MKKAEGWLLAQSLVVVAWCAGTAGLRAPGIPWVTCGLVLLAAPPLLSLGRAVRWRAFAPCAAYALLLLAALANPSHTPTAAGGWEPRPAWIPWLPTVVDRDLALAAAWPWLAALGQAGAVAAGLSSRAAQEGCLRGTSALVLALAFVGSLCWFGGATQILGVFPAPAPYFFATFIYKNHWAACALLGAAGAAGLAFAAWDRAPGNRRAASERLFWFAAAVLILMTLPLPGSRSGTLLGSLLALGLLGVSATRVWRQPEAARRRRQLGQLAGAVLLLGLALGGLSRDAWWRGYHKTREQLAAGGREGPAYLRWRTAGDTCRMAAARPVFGWGPGSFAVVFPLFQGDYGRDAAGHLRSRFDAAHCDWAQLPAEYGLLPGALFVGGVARAFLRGWRHSRGPHRWTLFGLALVAAYALADFPLQNRAVLLLAAILLAMAGRAPAPRAST